MNKLVKANDNGLYVIRKFTRGTFFDFKAMSGSPSETSPTTVSFPLDKNLLSSVDVDNLAKTLNRELCFICDEVDDSVGTKLAMVFIELLTEDSTRWLVKTASELTVKFIIHVSYVDNYFSEDAISTAWVSSVLDFTLSEHDYAHYVLKWGVPTNA